MIKKFGNQNLTDAFLKDMLARWSQITPLPNRKMLTIKNNLACSRNTRFLAQYKRLNHYGFFGMDFLTHLMELLMLQEKTNNPQAYMFKNVVGGLLSS
ncbi:MAG: hypothetical protein MUO36_00715, partial [Candidatus Hadarchaeum sp.]|nr:hypothetical protein [Candidatus Hadarchaeum sp.]